LQAIRDLFRWRTREVACKQACLLQRTESRSLAAQRRIQSIDWFNRVNDRPKSRMGFDPSAAIRVIREEFFWFLAVSSG